MFGSSLTHLQNRLHARVGQPARGGVQLHLDNPNLQSLDIWNVSLPSSVTVPLQVYGSDPAIPVVRPGDTVREGMLLASGSKKSVPVHAPIPGIVRDVTTVALANIPECPALIIDFYGSFDSLGKKPKEHDWSSLSGSEITELIYSMGVVESSRNNPSFIHNLEQLVHQPKDPVHLLLAAFDSDPMILTEQAVLTKYPREIMIGFEILRAIIPNATAWIVGNRLTASKVKWLRKQASTEMKWEGFTISTEYPAGNDLFLFKRIQGKEIAHKHKLIDHGFLSFSPTTLLQIFQAVVLRQAILDTICTIAGDAIQEPKVVKARIGESLTQVVAECGKLSKIPDRVVIGETLQGVPLASLDTPITKDSRGFLFLTLEQVQERTELECIQCGLCSSSCPVGLDPQLLHNLLEQNYIQTARAQGLDLCLGCGICSSVCPSRIPLAKTLWDRKEEAGV